METHDKIERGRREWSESGFIWCKTNTSSSSNNRRVGIGNDEDISYGSKTIIPIKLSFPFLCQEGRKQSVKRGVGEGELIDIYISFSSVSPVFAYSHPDKLRYIRPCLVILHNSMFTYTVKTLQESNKTFILWKPDAFSHISPAVPRDNGDKLRSKKDKPS